MALALAAIGAIGFGSRIAGAAPQQPLRGHWIVDIANTFFSELGRLLNALFPGSGSSTAPVSPGYPNTLLPTA
jgi:hypothetical protein